MVSDDNRVNPKYLLPSSVGKSGANEIPKAKLISVQDSAIPTAAINTTNFNKDIKKEKE